jgi:poly(A) polymerase
MSIKDILKRAPAWRGALKIINLLEDAGHEAFIVGGSVRDAILQQESDLIAPLLDFDIATSAFPEEVSDIFLSTIPVGAAFGVVIVRLFGSQYEVATFRQDLDYEDGRRPSGVLFATVKEDVQRRDFTINGLFYSPERDETSDLVGGIADLKAGLIRTIGTPTDRFAEDHLRLIRAVRFAARFHFKIEENTLAAIRNYADRITSVSPERLREEMTRILQGANPDYALSLLDDCRLTEPVLSLLPEMESTLDRFSQLQTLEFSKLTAALRPVAFFVFLCCPLQEELTEPDHLKTTMRRFRFSNQETATAIQISVHLFSILAFEQLREADRIRLLRDPLFPDVKELAGILYQLPLTTMSIAEEQLAERDLFPIPLLNGDDLIAAGLETGPLFKTILREVESAQLEGSIVDREGAIELAVRLAASD